MLKCFVNLCAVHVVSGPVDVGVFGDLGAIGVLFLPAASLVVRIRFEYYSQRATKLLT